MIHHTNLNKQEKGLIHQLLSSLVSRLDNQRVHDKWNMITDTKTNDILDWDEALALLIKIIGRIGVK